MTPTTPFLYNDIPAPAEQRRLLVSIHDVAPRHEDEVDRLLEVLASSGATQIAMLVVPNFWGSSPILAGTRFSTRLRRWADAGVEMFLHGSVHRDDTAHETLGSRLKARHMTAGEGEFLGLTVEDATHRINAGRELIEEVTGRPIAGFVAPAWLYGPGARTALTGTGIPIAEDHWHVWEPTSGRTLACSPVITWASRTPGRMASSLAVAAVARWVPLPRIMRVGVHPGDVAHPAILRSIESTVRHLARSRRISRYADLAEDARCAS